MNKQISWSLSDEVAPYFNSEPIAHICSLIDEKANNGLKYGDLKQQLLTWLGNAVDLNNPAPTFDVYRRAYEFARYF